MSAATYAVYRQFNSAGELLYVGITRSLIGRQAQHMRGSAWAREISTINMNWVQSEAEALAEEARAISTEKPRYNIKRPGGQSTVDDCSPWREALASEVAASGRSMRSISTAAGLSAGYVHSIINDGKEPTVSNMAAICAVLGIAVSRVMSPETGAVQGASQ